MPQEKAVMLHSSPVQCFVTTNSLSDGIVLWELRELKCQQRVCQHTNVVQTGQAGWMVLIQQWKMEKFTGWSALVTVWRVAKNISEFQLKIVDHFSSTNSLRPLVVLSATVAQTESETNNFAEWDKSLMDPCKKY